MIKPENFIYFLTVCGFFIGLVFSILTPMEPEMIIWTTISVTAAFYMVGLGSASFFIRYLDVKVGYAINRIEYEEKLDQVIRQIEKREAYIRDSSEFIEDLEQEMMRSVDEEKFLETSKR